MTTALHSPVFDARIAEQFDARCPFKLTSANLLVLAHVGSKSHGTYVPPEDPQAIDDVDYMGVVIPPVQYVLGVEHWEGVNFMHEELDVVIYSLRKFVGLLMKNNPNVLGMLWMRDEDYIVKHPLFGILLQSRSAFSSRLAYNSFLGYANSQLTKMTAFDEVTTRTWDEATKRVNAARWTVNEITDLSASLPMPDFQGFREANHGAFDLTDEDITRRLQDDIVVIRKLHARHFQGYMGEKRKALVKKYGYDTKNAAHLIRLMRMCCEFLETGELFVYRKGRDDLQLKAIKRGDWKLENVQKLAKDLFEIAHEKIGSSRLPAEPDRHRINNVLVYIQRHFYFPT